MPKRAIIQIRLNEERAAKLARILNHLRAVGISPKDADAIDFALSAAIEKINQPPK